MALTAFHPQLTMLAKNLDGERVSCIIMIAGGWEDDTKWQTMRKLGGMCFDQQFVPLAICLTSEAWREQWEEIDLPLRHAVETALGRLSKSVRFIE